MNPMAIVLALLTTVGAAGMLSGGRPRRVAGRDEDDPTASGDATLPETGTRSPTPILRQPIFAPNPPVQPGGEGSDGGAVEPTPLTGDPLSVNTGRVTTLKPAVEDVSSIRIVGQPEHGHVAVNPDNTLALVMTQTQATGAMSFTYEVTHSNGSTSLHNSQLDVVPGPQAKGWGTSEKHYMLAVDENDRVIVEHGANHRKFYISNSDSAISFDDLVSRYNLSTREWAFGQELATRFPQYGSTPELALTPDAGMKLLHYFNTLGQPNSNWLLLERGYTYGPEVGRLVGRGLQGESELHPYYVGAWGEGAKPVLTSQQYIFQNQSRNVVLQDLEFTAGLRVFDIDNLILDNLTFTGGEVTVEGRTSGVTIRNSSFYDIFREEPRNVGEDTWHPHLNRISGLFVNGTKGLLLEGNFFDQNGWAPDYRVDASIAGGQPPSMFSHNIYLQFNTEDVTLRDTISMRSASIGAQVRSGGFIEDNVWIDNQVAFNFLGGFGKEYYSLVADNVSTSAAYKQAPMIGALNWGMGGQGFLNALVDNIVAHSADPNNPAELAAKAGYRGEQKFNEDDIYDDTIVWNWGTAQTNGADRNVEGMDTAVLNQTTIQLFTAQLLGKPDATIGDLANVLRAQAHGKLDFMVDADLIIRFFQSGFGIAPDVRIEPGLLRFIPNDVGEGVRWDNRLNWSTQDLPGFAGLDSVDLGGNKVVFGGTVRIGELEFGLNGGLDVLHGKLTVTEGIESNAGATLDIGRAGQLWTDGARGRDILDIDVTGGRFANTGDFRMNVDLTASGGQTLLGVDSATFAVTNGSKLEIVGGAGRVGFDGEENGMAILGIGREGTLAFTAKDGRLGAIEEFRSGAFEAAPQVQSGVELNGHLKIDLADLADVSGSFRLMRADEIIGAFRSTTITGLGGRNAELVIDYASDTVALNLTAGAGAVKVSTIGNEAMFDATDAAIWNALTAGRGSYDTALPAEDNEEFLAVA